MSPDRQQILDVATEIGVSPSLVQKDWYATQILKAISKYQNKDFKPVFSGGTCLSKGYDLIQRFSEDLDFKANLNNSNFNRSKLKELRIDFLEHIKNAENIEIIDKVYGADENRFFRVLFSYPQDFERNNALRPEIKLEFRFENPKLSTEKKLISSLVSQASNLNAETSLICISPLETAADKFSALVWRLLKYKRGDENFDPTLIRHLHDLCALESIIFENKESFVSLLNEIYEEDRKRISGESLDLKNAAEETYHVLLKDELFEEDFIEFVSSMSYASKETEISFSSALKDFYKIAYLI